MEVEMSVQRNGETLRGEIAQLRECMQAVAVEVARIGQAVEPLVRIQEDQNSLRERVGGLEGFRAAVLWLVGLAGTSAVAQMLVRRWFGG